MLSLLKSAQTKHKISILSKIKKKRCIQTKNYAQVTALVSCNSTLKCGNAGLLLKRNVATPAFLSREMWQRLPSFQEKCGNACLLLKRNVATPAFFSREMWQRLPSSQEKCGNACLLLLKRNVATPAFSREMWQHLPFFPQTIFLV